MAAGSLRAACEFRRIERVLLTLTFPPIQVIAFSPISRADYRHFRRMSLAFPVTQIYRDWKYEVDVDYDNNKLVRYTLAFYRLHESGWYDEIRYDSHEWKKGLEVIAPHLHMKIRCAFKDSADEGVEEIKNIIDNHLEVLKETAK